MELGMRLMEKGLLPDRLIRLGIRSLLRQRLRDEEEKTRVDPELSSFIERISDGPIAVQSEVANEQHYEVDDSFFELVLGDHLKYSSCLWRPGAEDLSAAEEAMLELTCDRAELHDGQSVLELGCGWGSLTLWMAEHYPHSSITAVSNSHQQRQFIEQRAQQRGLSNLSVITCDINDFHSREKFERIVSVEMFEHMRNLALLFDRIPNWLREDGKLFVHVFCHRDRPYFFDNEGVKNWMGKYFFTGGMMPSFHLFEELQGHLLLEEKWKVSGTHYEKTARAWLENMDARERDILGVFERHYGHEEARMWFERWRVFFMSCEELFGFRDGEEWFVGHYRFAKAAS